MACLLSVVSTKQGWLAHKRLLHVQAILFKLKSLGLYHFHHYKSSHPRNKHCVNDHALSTPLLSVISLHTGVKPQTWQLKHIIPVWSLLPFICTAEDLVALVERHWWCTCITEQMSDLCSQTTMGKSSKVNMCVLSSSVMLSLSFHIFYKLLWAVLFSDSAFKFPRCGTNKRLPYLMMLTHFPWLKTHFSSSKMVPVNFILWKGKM